MFVYGSSYSCCDGYERVGVPYIVSDGVIQWVIFGVFMYEGLLGESIMVICEFNELYRVMRGGGYGCLCLVWCFNYAKVFVYGLGLAWHWHSIWWHVQWSSHSSTLFFLWLVVKGACITQGRESCVLICLQCVDYEVDCFVMYVNYESFKVRVLTCRQQMGPHFSFVFVA